MKKKQGLQMLWLTPVIPAHLKADGSLEARSSKPAWPTWWNPVSTKNTKLNQAWWWMLVVPATQEAKAGESLEPRGQRLQWAEIMTLHSRLGNRARLHLKKRKTRPYPCSSDLVLFLLKAEPLQQDSSLASCRCPASPSLQCSISAIQSKMTF